MRDCLDVRGPAKLNLALSVGGPDPEGMHPIAGWMATVDLHDDLELVRLPVGHPSRYAVIWHEDALRVSDIDWSVSNDLAANAHRALERAVGRGLSVQARIEKRIPVGGGLGGGSADAAAMLHGINALFELGLSTEELAEIAAPLGSDIPFLVHGGAAVVGGLGERIEPTPIPDDLHAVLVFPEKFCATGPVYRRLDEMRPEAPVADDTIRELAAGPVATETLFNDLTSPALDLHPEVATDRERIAEIAEAPVHLSGSGSTLFVPTAGDFEADLLANAIRERTRLPAVAVTATPGVTTGPIRRG